MGEGGEDCALCSPNRMDKRNLVCGEQIELSRMLEAREARAQMQQRILRRTHRPLISFTLNIAGPVKVFPLAASAFEEGVRLIACQCKAYGIPVVEKKEIRESAGWVCFFSVEGEAPAVKAALCRLEEETSLGRLFDMDVLDAQGNKISRTALGLPERTCLLCRRSAAVCARSRAHSVDELLERTCEILWDYFSEKYAAGIASIAVRALLYEVLATPKPGLVDKRNSGAHRDMDIFTFETSALALQPYFKAFVSHGIVGCSASAETLLTELRPIGIRAELAMLHATGGINTHKGIIFSMGLLCAALGRLYGRQEPCGREALQKECRIIAAPLAQDFQRITAHTAVTHGEKLFAARGIRGARGEAVDGFPTLFSVALPRFYELRQKGLDLNDAGALTLLSILAVSDDTNVSSRASCAYLEGLQHRLRQLIRDRPEQGDYRSLLESLDREFIAENVSPGGSADILAMLYFIHFLETEQPKNPDLRLPSME